MSTDLPFMHLMIVSLSVSANYRIAMEDEWEMLQKCDDCTSPSPGLAENARGFNGIEGDSEGMIRSDYFALDPQNRYRKRAMDDGREENSVDSDNTSWLDPGSEPRYGNESKGELNFAGPELPSRNSGDFLSDWGGEGSDVRKYAGVDGQGELDYVDDAKREVDYEGIEVGEKDSGEFWSDSGGNGSSFQKLVEFEGQCKLGYGDFAERDVGIAGIGLKRNISGEFWSDSSSEMLFSKKSEGSVGEGELGRVDLPKKGDESDCSVGFEGDGGEFSAKADEVKPEPKRVVWWKLPLDLLKFYASRVSPVWSFSIVAAVMGFFILGRRLHRMKSQSQSVAVKIFMDDKLSQLASRTARLNEAFSVVKRVPIVRASLPAAGGVTPWPVMSMR